MSKKILIPVILVLLVSMIAGGVALAQSGDTPPQPGAPTALSSLARVLAARMARLRNGSAIGQIVTANQTQLMIGNLSGGQHTYQVDPQTRYLDENGQPATTQNLAAGRWVIVQAARSGLTTWVARTVHLLPASFNPPADLDLLVSGKLSGVNADAGSFSMQTRSGQEFTFVLGEGAVILGQYKSLSDLAPEMQVIVAGINDAQGGTPTAYLVFARQQQERYAGSIIAVDPASSTFTLQTRNSGQKVTFLVNNDTRFRSRNDQYKSLADLQPGMLAAVQANQQGQGQWVANVVAVANKAQVPAYDLRLIGRIVSIDGDTLLIQNLHGWQYSVQVTADTHFMGHIAGLSDLKARMNVALRANKVNGVYLAQVILAPQLKRATQPTPVTPATTPSPSS